MIYARPLGDGHWLVRLDTPLGPLTLLLGDAACLGNLFMWLKSALTERLADDLLLVLAGRVP